jgi:hypothetical protein
MPHPALGLPPSEPLAGSPELAARLRADVPRLPTLALAAALRIDPSLRDRHDELAMRRFLRDYEGHVECLARAVASGEDRHVVVYAETLVPIYRRQGVRMNDVVTLVRGLEEACLGLSLASDAETIRQPVAAWIERLRRHRRLPGDHAGNPVARFIWKGAGLGDDSVV